METWISISIGLMISSVALYLFVRKSKNAKIPIDIQNLGMFLPPAVFIAFFNQSQKTSSEMSFGHIVILGLTAFFLCWLGNIASLKALSKAPNPGYSLIISKSYVLMTSILSVWLFDSPLTLRAMCAIVLVVAFSAMIIIDKDKSEVVRDSTWVWLSLGAFLAWGFLTLTLKYLTTEGLNPTAILFYLMLFVSIFITIKLTFTGQIFQLKKKYIPLFFLLGISSTFLNLFIIFGYQYAPNPGYINAANAGSIALVTVFSAVIFKDELNIKKILGVLGVIGSLLLLII